MITPTFIEEGHQYVLPDGRTVPSVNQILKLAQDEKILNKVPEARQYITIWPSSGFSSAMSHGTRIHKDIENWLRDGTEPVPEHPEFRGFRGWWEHNKVRLVWSEKILYTPDPEFVAGRADALIEWGRPLMDIPPDDNCLMDFKTGKRVYGSSYLQIAAYCRMARKMGIPINWAMILHLDALGNAIPFFLNEEQLEDYADIFNRLIAAIRES
jgi:hypothetical protein